MSTYTLPTISNGMDNLVIGTMNTVPTFTPLFLLFVYGSIFIGGMIRQKARTGFSDAPLWSTIGAIATLMIALPLSIFTSAIPGLYLAIVIGLTIVSGIWLFLDQNRNEVQG